MADPLKAAARPLTAFVDKRFGDLFTHVSNVAADLRRDLPNDVAAGVVGGVVEALDDHRAALHESVEQIEPTVVSLAEATVFLQQVAERLEVRLVQQVDVTSAERAIAHLRAEPHLGAAIERLLERTPLAELEPWLADLANWLGSHRSPQSEVGLWVNNPVVVRLFAGGAEVGAVNERIVELPYVYAALATVSPDRPVLDLGAAESTLALSLASSGRRTYAVEPRGYPFSHPNLEVVTLGVHDWEGPSEPLGAVISLSTIEHLGLGSYALDGGRPDADRDALTQLKGWLAPDGLLVLTAPYGRASVDELQRVYDPAGLERLLEGWTLDDLSFCRPQDAVTWVPCPAEDLVDAEVPGVVLLRARPA